MKHVTVKCDSCKRQLNLPDEKYFEMQLTAVLPDDMYSMTAPLSVAQFEICLECYTAGLVVNKIKSETITTEPPKDPSPTK